MKAMRRMNVHRRGRDEYDEVDECTQKIAYEEDEMDGWTQKGWDGKRADL